MLLKLKFICLCICRSSNDLGDIVTLLLHVCQLSSICFWNSAVCTSEWLFYVVSAKYFFWCVLIVRTKWQKICI